MTVRKRLFALQDPAYQAFQRKLIPTVDPETILGVRIPALRALAKELAGSDEAAAFLQALPHTYLEENCLHGFLLEKIKDFDRALEAVDAFLPCVDNWAVCDLLSPKVFAKHTDELLPHVRRWMADDRPYTIRFGVGMLMRYYLDDGFCPGYLDEVAALSSDEYYVNMMLAWFFSVALVKQYAATLPYLEEGRLDVWVHNKTIQKAVESYRITEEQKAYLRSLRRKEHAGVGKGGEP